ncbi:MAG TPA: SIMPL domain-containing protein [Burkholderiales bacterium]|nr:SIMPL domain-containing protein [Burkholderiales bacterium]
MKWILFFLCFLAFDAQAAEGTLIKAEGEAHAPIRNDTLNVFLSFEMTGQDPARLAREIEDEVSKALERARNSGEVKIRTAGYSISPIFDRQRITGERADYRLVLETRNFDAGLSLASSLQPFQISGMNFSVSFERRKAAKERLLPDAIADLRKKIDIVGRSLKASKIEIREISIEGSAQPRPLAMAAIPAEPGESDVSVSVTGTAIAR